MKLRFAYAALVLTCVVPLLGLLYRGTMLVLDWDWVPLFVPSQVDNLPLLIHVAGAGLYYPLAALQIAPAFRNTYPRWHRNAGKVAIVAGIASAFSATWLTLVHPDVSGPILYYGRVVVGPLWALFLMLGLTAVRRRDFERHRDWMIRAFAISMPASTLVFFIVPFSLVLGGVPELVDDGIQPVLWVLHLVVAETVIRRIRKNGFTIQSKGVSQDVHKTDMRGSGRSDGGWLRLPKLRLCGTRR